MENLLKGFTTLVKQSEEMSIILNNLDEVFQEGGMTNLPGSTLTEILALRKIIDSMGMGMVPPKDLERFESKCQKIEIDGPAGKIPLRIIVPENEIRGGMLHIHGGGWFCGTPEMNAPQLLSWANDIGLAISSVDYRLAPETHTRQRLTTVRPSPLVDRICKKTMGLIKSLWVENLPVPIWQQSPPFACVKGMAINLPVPNSPMACTILRTGCPAVRLWMEKI